MYRKASLLKITNAFKVTKSTITYYIILSLSTAYLKQYRWHTIKFLWVSLSPRYIKSLWIFKTGGKVIGAE